MCPMVITVCVNTYIFILYIILHIIYSYSYIHIRSIRSSILDQNDNNIVKRLLYGVESFSETQNTEHFDGILNIF